MKPPLFALLIALSSAPALAQPWEQHYRVEGVSETCRAYAGQMHVIELAGKVSAQFTQGNQQQNGSGTLTADGMVIIWGGNANARQTYVQSADGTLFAKGKADCAYERAMPD